MLDAQSAPLLEAVNLTKRYEDGVLAVDHINFTGSDIHLSLYQYIGISFFLANQNLIHDLQIFHFDTSNQQ